MNIKTMVSYSNKQIAKKVIDFCLGNYKFIFIAGNGGSGKTTLSKDFASEMESRGLVVTSIDMDEFVLDTQMRKSARKTWIDADGNTRESDYSTSFRESYYLSAVETIMYSLNGGKDCYFKRKKGNEFIEVKTQTPLVIFEGIGTAFLEKDEKTFGIFLTCDQELEIDRRIQRARNGEHNLPREEVEQMCRERNEQFETIVLPKRKKFDLELSSNNDYSLHIERDDFDLFKAL